MSIPKT